MVPLTAFRLDRAPVSDDYSLDTIIVVVGQEQKRYSLDHDVLTTCSAYFRNALQYGSGDGIIRLPDVNSQLFNSYVHWVRKEVVKVDEPQNQDGVEPNHVMSLVPFYSLSTRLQDETLQVKIIDQIIRLSKVDRMAWAKAMMSITKLTGDDSVIKRLLVDSISPPVARAERILQQGNGLNQGTVAAALVDLAARRASTKSDRCKYPRP
jgi:hypothetical protein